MGNIGYIQLNLPHGWSVLSEGEYSPFWVLCEMNEKTGPHHPTIPVSIMVLHEFSYIMSIHHPTISFLDHVLITDCIEKYLKHEYYT